MKKKNKHLPVIITICGFLAIPFLIFQIRSPVLILTEQSFIRLYGQDRMKNESFRSSLALFRPVKTVIVANDAGDDIIQYAITNISSRPFCVIFPLRFINSAAIFSRDNPAVPLILLEGRGPAANKSEGYFIYKTDIEADFYRAGVAASYLDMEKNGTIALFLEQNIRQQAREAFLKGIDDQGKQLDTRFFSSYSEFFPISNLSCVILAGTGSEYLDEKSGIPIIFLSWLDPTLIPKEVVLLFDDSPWAQAVQAVKLAKSGTGSGSIPSKILALDREKINKSLLHKIHKMW